MENPKIIQLHSLPRQELIVEVFSAESLVIQFRSHHYEARAFDGGESNHYRVLTMRSRIHGVLQPVWNKHFTVIAPGIDTRQFEIVCQRIAGPLSIQFEHTRYTRYASRRTGYEDERSTFVRTFWLHCHHETVTDDIDFI
jgi:hypothetical protein